MLTTVVIVAAFIGYFFYESSVPGNVSLNLYTVYYEKDDIFGNSSILEVLADFTEVQVHSAGQGIQTGWHIIMQTGNPSQSDLTSHDCRIGLTCLSWTFTLAPGSYDFVKFNASNIIMDIDRVGNVSYALSGGGFEPLIIGPSLFIVQPSQELGIRLDLRFSVAEVYARNGYLHAISIMLLPY